MGGKDSRAGRDSPRTQSEKKEIGETNRREEQRTNEKRRLFAGIVINGLGGFQRTATSSLANKPAIAVSLFHHGPGRSSVFVGEHRFWYMGRPVIG